ncbi:MAG: hypothetical protein CEN89_108 [Candidatus Berkelbacteria bacterium Licking1014_7]|uniref:RNA-binding protein KhpA n=1 Tax=Candidatus Berkelbacteria bacterium Licking1014_7 TaxID=2017147 RepID=A0A554LKN8_9BACT|nr:MAG: hypothetical protein CEN89_108 [Candidatus Berkelbacteria bacterium Licking1014_7]
MADETAKQDIEYVEAIVKGIVDSPEDVKVDRKVDEMGVLLSLSVDAADMGKVIGKEGQTAKAIRTLLRVYGAKSNARINFKILEPEGSERAESSERTESSISDRSDTTPIEEKTTEVV